MKKESILFIAVLICILTAINGVSATNNTLSIDVNYEYSNDNFNPSFSVVNNNNNVQFIKEKDSSLDLYKLILNSSEISPNSKYDISVSAPGYITQIQKIDSNGEGSFVLSNLSFKMKANNNYKLGKDVTIAADKLLNFKSADNVLVITTAGVPKINNKTSEDCIEGILSETSGIVSYGKGNILMLRQTAVDPIVFAFITRNGNSLTAAVYGGSTSPSYFGTISDNMSRKEWNNFVDKVGSENAFSFASLANGWVSGVSSDVLQEAAFHGHICEGTLTGYSIVRTLLTYYPPKQETAGGSGSPGDITSYKVLGIPGDSDDDAVLFFLDATPGKNAYIGYNTTNTGATKDMIGFIRWENGVIEYNSTSNAYEIVIPGKGTLVVMSFDSDKNEEKFKQETGINPKDGNLEGLKYQDWWIKNIYKNPTHLVNILYELDNLTEEQYYYFIGLASDVKFPNKVKNATNAGKVRISAIKAHGLDLAYIKELAKTLPTAKRDNKSMGNGKLTYNDFKNIGKTASLMAKQYFKNELNITVEKDNPNLAVITSAGYVYFNGQTTEAVKDGINEVFGSTLNRKNLISLHFALWKPLWMAFALKDNGRIWTVFIRYNPNGTYFVGEANGHKVNDIGMETLNNTDKINNLTGTAIPDNWFNIQSIANTWNGNPSFDQLLGFIFHDHACPGVQPGFFITKFIQENYPLSVNESYSYIASSIYCKDDSLVYLLGVSPGMGTYFSQKLPSNETESPDVDGASEEGVLMIWDKNLNIGRAVIINFKWPTINRTKYATSDASRAATIQAFLDMYAGRPNADIIEGISIKATSEKWINSEQFEMLKAGGGDTNPLRYLENIPKVTKKQLLDSMKKEVPIKKDDKKSNNGTVLDDGTIPSTKSTFGDSSSKISKYSYGLSGSGLFSTDKNNNPISDAGEEEAGDSGDTSSGKSYEVTKSSISKNNGNQLIYALIFVIIIAAIAGFGFMRYRNNH